MQALSQLSYGPAVLRAGNHSDIESAWEVIRRKKICWMRLPLGASTKCICSPAVLAVKTRKKSPGSAEAFR
ncbi:hypothetical protein XhhCFBP4925_11775 [Xanthomonas hortorum pv. hederae]|nr:hypothetical protein XhhCFBP4925_11775 [Xanthomonas hortorum pv. hederae]PUE99757.1 hypothetical protein C7T87_12010 [Xanthomonas hortorum pv. hederae]